MEAKGFPMNSGKGAYSYYSNSSLQRRGADVVKEMIQEAVIEKFDIKSLGANPNIISLADFGCSVGPNTFYSMENILEAMKSKFNSQDLEFLVYFNDQASNDFNTLFTSIPETRSYFSAGVPGSFYGRLFPKSCLHFAQSTYALQWMSKVPKELNDKTSPCWNKGKIFYAGASEKVAKAYSNQFCKDMEVFLEARAAEIVTGGMMILILPACPDGTDHFHLSTRVLTSLVFDIIEKSLLDMVKDGSITEAQVNSFNLPLYIVSPNEMKQLITKNGCFDIEKIEPINSRFDIDGLVDIPAFVRHLRAGFEGVLSNHFGSEAMDELFGRVLDKFADQFIARLESVNNEGTQLLLVLKRK